jgi:hypothetical protein
MARAGYYFGRARKREISKKSNERNIFLLTGSSSLAGRTPAGGS